jgi:hypothetical protein
MQGSCVIQEIFRANYLVHSLKKQASGFEDVPEFSVQGERRLECKLSGGLGSSYKKSYLEHRLKQC